MMEEYLDFIRKQPKENKQIAFSHLLLSIRLSLCYQLVTVNPRYRDGMESVKRGGRSCARVC